MLPNFLVIGPGKSGTTWLYHALRDHPQICVSSAKETLFFENEFNRGLEWYSGFFDHCDKDAKAIGEVSNTYIFNSAVPERIKSVNSQMKLITCLRNPIERTFSHYLFLIRSGEFNGSFRDALNEFPWLISKGKYRQHLLPYLETFDRRQLCILFFDDLEKDDISFVQNIYNFLRVDKDYVPEMDKSNKLSAAKPRSRFLALIVKKGARLTRKLGQPDLISKIKYSGITKYLYKEYGEKPEMSENDRDFLKGKFYEETEKLGSLLDKNLIQEWFDD